MNRRNLLYKIFLAIAIIAIILFALTFVYPVFFVNSYRSPSPKALQCKDGRDSVLQSKTDSILLDSFNNSSGIVGMLMSVAEIDCGQIRAHSAIIKNERSGEYDDSLDLSASPFVMPGAIMQPATLAYMMEYKWITLHQRIPTNHGMVGNHILPRSESIMDYELKTGLDSISIEDAFLRSDNYLPYFLAEEYLTTREGYTNYSDYLILLYGACGKEWIPPYGTEKYSASTPHTVASGHSIFLSHKQLLRFYSVIANGGARESESVTSKETADTLSGLLRKSVLEEMTSHTCADISGKSGYGVAFSFDIPAIEAVSLESPLKEFSFAGFYPSDTPTYSFIITILSREEVTDISPLKVAESFVNSISD